MEAIRKQRGQMVLMIMAYWHLKKGKFIDLVSQVKCGHTNPGHIQAFNGVRQPVGADLGIFTYFENKGTQGLIFFNCKHWSVYGYSQSPDLHNINYLKARI